MREKIKLMFDYLQGAIWTSDIETGEPLTGIDIVDKDDIIKNETDINSLSEKQNNELDGK